MLQLGHLIVNWRLRQAQNQMPQDSRGNSFQDSVPPVVYSLEEPLVNSGQDLPTSKEQLERVSVNFHEYLEDIFQSYEMIIAGDSVESMSIEARGHWEYYDNESRPHMNDETHWQLSNYFNKLRILNGTHEISVDDIVRLQRICEDSIRLAESVATPSKNAHGSIFNFPDEAIGNILRGLVSTQTLFLTMVGGRTEKEVYPEENHHICNWTAPIYRS